VIRRVLQAVRPAIVIVLETEIWPNFLREAKRKDLPVLFVSGRIRTLILAVPTLFWQGWLFPSAVFAETRLEMRALFLMQSERMRNGFEHWVRPAIASPVSGT